MRNVICIVLGGGRGTRLYPLTKYRSKPAVPLTANYRLIDIPLSNCLNSGLNHIYVLTQFLSVSLHRHIRQTYRFDHFSGGFVEILAAQQTMDEGATDWYQGTADAVRKQLRYIQQPGVEYVLILSGDQLYRMNYRELLQTHRDSKADATIAALPVTRDAARSFGIMRIDQDGRVVGFVEKPQTADDLNLVRMEPEWIDARGIDSRGRDCLANMGVYIFNRDVLEELLLKTDYRDFGKEIFPTAIRSKRVQVHLFDGYWEDVGTIKSYYDSSLSLASAQPPFDLASAEAPIYSRPEFLPPTQIQGATVRQSLIADGCRISEGAVIENSIIGLRWLIGPNVTIRDSIVLGADAYESEGELSAARARSLPPIGIGEGSLIVGSILDKNCRVGRRVEIVNRAGTENSPGDADDCLIRDGIPIVLKDAVIPDGWKLA
ncbi:MAG: glucose-1-phosphate adenylyltransferase [Planctomycetota bacterium]